MTFNYRCLPLNTQNLRISSIIYFCPSGSSEAIIFQFPMDALVGPLHTTLIGIVLFFYFSFLPPENFGVREKRNRTNDGAVGPDSVYEYPD